MLLPLRFKTLPVLLMLLTLMLGGVIAIGYLIPDRTYVYSYWFAVGVAFASYFLIISQFNDDKFAKFNYGGALILRLSLLLSFPLLSDDFYRFFWDGAQIFHGINPFSFTPKELLAFNYSWVDLKLFEKMNSPLYYSVYPPINQLAFLLTALAGKGNLLSSIVVLRLFILIFDLGNIYLIKKLLHRFKISECFVFLYALNPLAIVELTGNLHFEAVMIFFTLLSFWLLVKNKWILASVALAFAVCAKLLPLLFLPLFIKHIGFKKTIYAGLIVGLTVTVLFLPFIHNLTLLQNFLSSIHLYYGSFEFNGSVFQLLKAAGWGLLGYNPTAYTNMVLAVFTILGFLVAFLKCKNILEGSFWFMFTYYLFNAVVHPWYIVILVCFTPFIKWRFALSWSALICLTYFAYASIPYHQNVFLTFIEYALLACAFTYEWWNKNHLKEKLV